MSLENLHGDILVGVEMMTLGGMVQIKQKYNEKDDENASLLSLPFDDERLCSLKLIGINLLNVSFYKRA